jgi:RHS repeat-associated protein
VTYEGGSTTVTVNQRVSGGQWVLLGTFPFNATGTGYKVDLADTSLTGKVVADAIYYVQDGAPVDSFTWTPTISSAGEYQLYARWTASSANSGAAQYTVVHDGGTSLVTVSQKQNGGQWNLLGTWNFAPSAGHQVTLTASSDGNVVADAIKLVGTGPAPADLVYLHSDQIGLPQKITDAAQAVVWDRVQDPFGRPVSLTSSGGIDTSLRFPGQQADPDTGFAYNYFRDYDPTLGRYIQADPIGLTGGINRYVYVRNNPFGGIDPIGLEEYPNDFVGPLPETGYWTSEMTVTICGRVPPSPPGVTVDANMQIAAAHGMVDYGWFRSQVRNHGPWDYKQVSRRYTDFGNFNYGATGTSMGIPSGILHRVAGWAQESAGTSTPEWGHWYGSYPYGDDPADQQKIRSGIEYCGCMQNQPTPQPGGLNSVPTGSVPSGNKGWYHGTE